MTDARDENGELLSDEDRLTDFCKKLKETGNKIILWQPGKSLFFQGFAIIDSSLLIRNMCTRG